MASLEDKIYKYSDNFGLINYVFPYTVSGEQEELVITQRSGYQFQLSFRERREDRDYFHTYDILSKDRHFDVLEDKTHGKSFVKVKDGAQEKWVELDITPDNCHFFDDFVNLQQNREDVRREATSLSSEEFYQIQNNQKPFNFVESPEATETAELAAGTAPEPAPEPAPEEPAPEEPEPMPEEPVAEPAHGPAPAPVAPKREAGSTRNLISVEGEVGYIYLPRTPNTPPQYLRVMQKHGKMYLNMTGINPRQPSANTTCQILDVSSENVESRGNCLALDLSYGGRRHRIVLPIQADLERGVNAELLHDLKSLVENRNIQLNQIKPWERPDVRNFAYAPEMERAIEPRRAEPSARAEVAPDETAATEEPTSEEVLDEREALEGTVSLGKQTRGTGARTGQKFEDLKSTYSFGGVSYTGLTQTVRLGEELNLGPQQKISLYKDDEAAKRHLLANVTRDVDGKTQTIYAVFEEEDKKSLLISDEYLREMQDSNPGFAIPEGEVSPVDGYHTFEVTNIQLTADGELLYGIQVAGREVAISANARGSQIIAQVDGVQRRAILANTGAPLNIGLGTKMLNDRYLKGTNITIKPGSNQELVNGLLVQRGLLERMERNDEPLVSVGVPKESPQVTLYNAKIQQKTASGKASVETAVNFAVRGEQLFVYAKVGGHSPAWMRVDSARLAQTDLEGTHNQALLLTSTQGTAEVTIPIEMDFVENKEILAQLNSSIMKDAFSVRTKEGSKSQRGYFYKADDEAEPSVHDASVTPPEGALSVYERTNQKTANKVVFDVLGNLQADLSPREAAEGIVPPEEIRPAPEHRIETPPEAPVEEVLDIPEKIDDPKKADKPKEMEAEEWKPHGEMPKVRNCLIGAGVIVTMLSVFLPFLAVIAPLFFGGAFVVEWQPWNAIGQARQERVQRQAERIENSHKQIERQLEQVVERFNDARIELSKIEDQLKDPALSPRKRRQLEQQRQHCQREILNQKLSAQAIQVSAKAQAKWNLVKLQEDAIQNHRQRHAEKEEVDYVRLRTQARERDEQWNRADETERREFEDLSQREAEGRLSEEEAERLRRYRERFSLVAAAEQQIENDRAADERHRIQLTKNMESLRQERDAADEELQAAQAARDNPNPPESEWIGITSSERIDTTLRTDPGYDSPLPGSTQSREETESSPSRAPEVDAYGRRREPRSRESGREMSA